MTISLSPDQTHIIETPASEKNPRFTRMDYTNILDHEKKDVLVVDADDYILFSVNDIMRELWPNSLRETSVYSFLMYVAFHLGPVSMPIPYRTFSSEGPGWDWEAKDKADQEGITDSNVIWWEAPVINGIKVFVKTQFILNRIEAWRVYARPNKKTYIYSGSTFGLIEFLIKLESVIRSGDEAQAQHDMMKKLSTWLVQRVNYQSFKLAGIKRR